MDLESLQRVRDMERSEYFHNDCGCGGACRRRVFDDGGRRRVCPRIRQQPELQRPAEDFRMALGGDKSSERPNYCCRLEPLGFGTCGMRGRVWFSDGCLELGCWRGSMLLSRT